MGPRKPSKIEKVLINMAMNSRKPSKLKKILASVGVVTFCGLSLYNPNPTEINGQSPVVRERGNGGYLHVGYDFDKDRKLDRVDSHFYLGDHSIPYHSFNINEDSPHFKGLQDKYNK